MEEGGGEEDSKNGAAFSSSGAHTCMHTYAGRHDKPVQLFPAAWLWQPSPRYSHLYSLNTAAGLRELKPIPTLWETDIPSATVWAFHAFPSLIRTQQESCDWRHPSPTHTYYQCPSLLSRKVMWPSSASQVGGGEAVWTCSLLGGQPHVYGRKRSYHNSCRRSAPGSAVRDGKFHF